MTKLIRFISYTLLVFLAACNQLETQDLSSENLPNEAMGTLTYITNPDSIEVEVTGSTVRSLRVYVDDETSPRQTRTQSPYRAIVSFQGLGIGTHRLKVLMDVEVLGRISEVLRFKDFEIPGTTMPTPEPAPMPEPTPMPEPAPMPEEAFTPGMSWYWQLQGTINTSVKADVYNIDLFDNSASTIATLKKSGRKVICYFSAGSYENWRPDAKDFPAAALGNNLDGWPGERWLDVRNSKVREIMVKRMDLAVSKGCDALEPDNVDGYSNRSGFNYTKSDQIEYLRYLADQAHARGLLIALKNATDLVTSLVDNFDFAVVEECFHYNECERYSPFVRQNKAVFSAEYSSYSNNTCSRAKALGFSTVFYSYDLNGKRYEPCQ